MKQKNKYLLILIIFCIFSFFFFENRVPFTETSDARYSEIAYETLKYGHWLIPTQNKIIHITKPPLTYWLTALGYKIFGVNEFGGRFFSGLCGTVSSILVFFIAFILFDDNETAFYSGIVFASTPLIIGASRIVTTDVFLLTSMLFSIYFFLRFIEEKKETQLYLFWIFLGISGFIKGPLGYIQVIPIVLIYLKIFGKFKEAKSIFKPFPVIISLTIGFWWFIYISVKIPNSVHFLLGKEFAARFYSKNFGHPRPTFLYLKILITTAYPWIFILLFSITDILKKIKEQNQYKFLTAMFLYPIILFSIPKSKLSLYILLSLAGLSILVARILVEKKKCIFFTVAAVFEISLIVAVFFIKSIPINNGSAALIFAIISVNLLILFIKSNKKKTIITGAKIVLTIILVIYTTSFKPEKYFFTMKTTANFINKLSKKPEKVYLVGFNSRSFILYTKIHPIETRFDKEFIYSDPETKEVLIHIEDLMEIWPKQKNSLLIVLKKQLNLYLFLFDNPRIIFKDSRFVVLSK